jgi:hypothetical protein
MRWWLSTSAMPLLIGNDSADKFAPFSGWSLCAAEALWLIIKNLGRDERGRRNRCQTTSMTICGPHPDERDARQRRNGLSGP